MTRPAVTWATVLGALLFTSPASSQKLLVGGGVGLGTGLERSDDLPEGLFRRARTRIVVPLDFRIDEAMTDGIGVVGVFEIEPRTSFGADLRYMRWVSSWFIPFAGVSAIVAPKALLGVNVGVDLRLPFGRSGLALFVEPSLSAMALGSDLPEDRVLVWALIAAGIHVGL